jgi:hypothetical protein
MQDSLTLAVSGRRNTFAPSLGRRLTPNLSASAPVVSHSAEATVSSSANNDSVDAAPGPVAHETNASGPVSIRAAATSAVVHPSAALGATGVIPNRGSGAVNSSSISGGGVVAGVRVGNVASSSSVLSLAPRLSLQVSSSEALKPAMSTAVPSTPPQPLIPNPKPVVIHRAPMRSPTPGPASSVGLTIKALMTDRDVQSRLKRSVSTDDSDSPVKKRITAPPPTPSLFAPTSHASVQVKIINGRISLDEASLEVSANAGPEPDEAFGQVVENSGLVSCIAGRREYCKAWGTEETDNLHKAIGMFGLDFQTIAVYLGTGRTRKQVLAKFKREEQQNPHRVEASMKIRSGSSSWRELQEDLIKRAQGDSLQHEDASAAGDSAAVDSAAVDSAGEAP